MSREIGRGWATVELELAVVELAGLLAPGATFEEAARCVPLGARCARAVSAGDHGWLVILEPDTEGRLARFLARHGETWAATWFTVDPDRAIPVAAAGTPGVTASTPGPLGREWLEPETSPDGPFRLQVATATIGR